MELQSVHAAEAVSGEFERGRHALQAPAIALPALEAELSTLEG